MDNSYVLNVMKKLLRNLAVATATIFCSLLTIIILFLVVCFLLQFQLTLYILLISIVLSILIATGWQMADSAGWIKK